MPVAKTLTDKVADTQSRPHPAALHILNCQEAQCIPLVARDVFQVVDDIDRKEGDTVQGYDRESMSEKTEKAEEGGSVKSWLAPLP